MKYLWFVGDGGRLNEGLEAMDMLNFGRPGEVQEESEISKMWSSKFRQARPSLDVVCNFILNLV